MAPYGKHHMLLIRAETFIVRGTILIPSISNGQLITNKKIFLLFMLGFARGCWDFVCELNFYFSY